jgi:ABC-type Fe3+/spermidine/putrescine transport system ATPase subunit
MSKIILELKGVSKAFFSKKAACPAVDDFSLDVPLGSFTTLLGPSGCGKTTLLRVIAGFYEPDKGSVFINGVNQKNIPPEKRGTGIVFQDYALFPHMNVRENLCYGLTIRKKGAAQKKAQTERLAAMLGIEELLERYPLELSGGQQQRVALGRVLALEPQILLMDEPFTSLDAKLRVHVREELKVLQQTLGVTTIYVTHDQEEALLLSDYIAVMRNGHLEQMGTPLQIYNEPKTVFAADFSGPANFITLDGIKCLARPEWLKIVHDDSECSENGIQGVMQRKDFLGRISRARVMLDSGEIVFAYLSPNEERFCEGTRVRVIVEKKFALGG